MSGKERMEILRMVSEGKITAEEGARLLEALGKGERGRKPMEGFMEDLESTFANPLQTFGAVMSDLGRSIGSVVGDSFSSFWSEWEGEGEDIPLREGGFDLEAGGTLSIRHAPLTGILRKGRLARGFLALRPGTEETRCVVEGADVSLRKREGQLWLLWRGGDLEVELPKALGKVDLVCLSGDVEVGEVGAELVIKNMGGPIRVERAIRPFRLRSMGGGVKIGELALTSGEGEADSVGGPVEIALGPSFGGRVSVTNIGGKIALPQGHEVDRERGLGRRTASFRMGTGDAEVRVHAMGGDVVLRKLS